ncbi:hypothetical protein C1A_1016 [Wolbachia endosymbiont of Culex quinquefasciatus JHB]|uniref:Jg18360 protein n=2 Tax=cellular organisms TaxID=131567 RepID=A0A8S4RFJ3_9NEOP|nr:MULTISPECIES: hypothetical protein [Wolbachia]CAH2235658.1 jg18360 [Pararge aegeria aegeria]EEB55994.1 hypothetical protein C1A_1016 [Wolbachia endosymbiont of Culex quinquefasciatus JHB]QEK89966.1 hypothetical protein CAI20_04720 [Wolbachia endosymbiont of Chrysomya megacephala]CAQ54116.1 hypothetical protein WP0007 [Wolbachia endosymbiont of Culex quinquefasciatus Pel]CQD07375.1 Uncharacterised protein [Wolbachia endosymbiont wPip_Mol of Culex molestus]
MLIFKNHRGQLHKTNTALLVLTSLYVIGAAVALSSPYLMSSTYILVPLAAFAATPLGMSVLAFVTVALISLAIYSFMKNNEISELKAPRIVAGSSQRYLMLQVTNKDLEFIEKNYKNENGEYTIDFTNSKGEVFKAESYGQIRYIGNPDPILLGNTKLLDIHQLYKKKGDSTFEQINCGQELKTLGLNVEENNVQELTIEFVPSSIVKSPKVEHEKPERLLISQV